jgi:hypothetical protein
MRQVMQRDPASSATEIQFQGSSDGVTTGSVAEVLTGISSNLTTGNFQQHRIAIQSQGQPITVAQAQFNVAVTGVNEELPCLPGAYRAVAKLVNL